MTAVPDEAIAAAMAELDSWQKDDGKTFDPRRVVQKLIEAAAPAIRAAERERIRALATEHDAYYTRRMGHDDAGMEFVQECDLPFADLLATP